MRASGGTRLEWDDMPVVVRRALESALGSGVVEAHNQAGGFSPGLAARCLLDSDERVFIKAVSPAQNPQSTRIHRREAEVARYLTSDVAAPRLRHVHDDGVWVALVFDEIDGRQPTEPWTYDDLDVVIPAVTSLSQHVVSDDALQSVQDRHRTVFRGWRRLASDDGNLSRIDTWALEHLDALAEIESSWEDAAGGDCLLHADLRADNILIDPAGDVWFVDWPWACAGAEFVDLVMMLPSIGLGGGPSPSTVVERYGLFGDVERDALVSVVAAVAGFMVRSSLDPAPPGLPLLRDFQRAQGGVALAWLRSLQV